MFCHFLRFALLTLSCLVIDPVLSSAQELIGSPFIRNFTTVDFSSRPRNWAIVQDSAGIYYIGNDLNLLTFDGNHWWTIPINNTIVRTITMDPNGKIYVGAQGDFGYLSKTEKGALQFVSMLHLIDPAERNFTDVWSLHVTSESIYVQTSFRTFRITGSTVKSWKTNSAYHRSFMINGVFYISPFGSGLQRLINDELVNVPGAEPYRFEQLSMMIPISDSRILLGFQRKGIVEFNPKATSPELTFRPFRNDVEDYLLRDGIFCATQLPSGDLAIGTLSGGVVILSPQGKKLMQADENSGLLSNMSLQLLVDRTGNLIVTNNGFSIIEYNSPIRLFNRGNGLSGIILSAQWVNDTFYVGSAEGLFYFNEQRQQFQKIEGILTQCWNLIAYGPPQNKSLIVSSTFGFYEVQGTKVTQLSNENFYNLVAHPLNPNLIFSGQENSISVMEKVNGVWKRKSIPIKGITDFWSATIDGDLNLWLGTDIYGLIRIPLFGLGTSIDSLPEEFRLDGIQQYTKAQGLPSMYRTYVFTHQGKVYAPSENGVYTFNQTFNRFDRDTVMFKSLVGRRVFQLGFDQKGRIWFDSRQGKGWIEKRGDKWVMEENALKRIPPTPGYTGHSSRIYCDPSGLIWFGNSEGLFQFDPEKSLLNEKKESEPEVLLRTVQWNDSLVFMGHGMATSSVISPGQNHLTFSYASPYSSGIDNNQFSYQLAGFRNSWSEWSRNATQDFLNLPSGDYIFKVKTRNLKGQESAVVEYPFTILPPWYTQWYMIITYALATYGFIFGIVRWREKSTRKEKAILERVIQHRTQELKERNNELEKSREEILKQKNDLEQQKAELTQTKQKIEQYNEELESAVEQRTKVLADQNQQLEQFSFVTAHNLRSPVAKVMALVNLLQVNSANPATQQEMLKKLSQSALDLDIIIKDLGTILELRKGHAIKMEEVSLRNTVDLILRSFEELIHRSDIKVRADIELDYIVTFPAYLNSILYNLMSNAIKYRAAERIALIDVQISKKDKAIFFRVEDNGIGFDSEKFGNKVFEPFKRLTNQKDGKGLGMFLVKSQVEALGGQVSISSKPGVGTVVVFQLPAYNLGETVNL